MAGVGSSKRNPSDDIIRCANQFGHFRLHLCLRAHPLHRCNASQKQSLAIRSLPQQCLYPRIICNAAKMSWKISPEDYPLPVTLNRSPWLISISVSGRELVQRKLPVRLSLEYALLSSGLVPTSFIEYAWAIYRSIHGDMSIMTRCLTYRGRLAWPYHCLYTC